MHLKIKTAVASSLEEVKQGFNQELFLKLNPPFPPVRLVKFDGCKAGDEVSLELNFLLFKQLWVSDIVEDKHEQEQWYFVDEGRKLPFFLKSWKHIHRVEVSGDGAIIIDDISFSTGTIFTDWLMYPALYFQFLYRKPIYKKVFRKL